MSEPESARSGRRYMPLILAALMMLLGLAMFASILRGPRDSFDQQVWLQAGTIENDTECRRGRMARHLREHVLREGMTRDAVLALLGPAQPANAPNTLRYPLGLCGHPDGPARLDVNFDTEGRLTDTEVAGLR